MIKHDHMIIAGDFNLKQINWDTREVSGNPGCYAYQIFYSINDLFLEEMVKQPTRFRGTDNPSALDWILTGNSGMIDEITAEPPLSPSDHCLLSTNYNWMIEKKHEDDINNYNYNKGDYYAMRNDLLDIDWEAELRDKHTQQIWDILENKINGLIEKHIPKKKYTTSKSPPWYDREISLSKDKKKAWRT